MALSTVQLTTTHASTKYLLAIPITGKPIRLPSFRDGEELMSSRGVSMSYESVREWRLKFDQTYANGCAAGPPLADRSHLDEVVLKINGRVHFLWRAVDHDGDVLDILVQGSRDKKVAKKFFPQTLKGIALPV